MKKAYANLTVGEFKQFIQDKLITDDVVISIPIHAQSYGEYDPIDPNWENITPLAFAEGTGITYVHDREPANRRVHLWALMPSGMKIMNTGTLSYNQVSDAISEAERRAYDPKIVVEGEPKKRGKFFNR